MFLVFIFTKKLRLLDRIPVPIFILIKYRFSTSHIEKKLSSFFLVKFTGFYFRINPCDSICALVKSLETKEKKKKGEWVRGDCHLKNIRKYFCLCSTDFVYGGKEEFDCMSDVNISEIGKDDNVSFFIVFGFKRYDEIKRSFKKKSPLKDGVRRPRTMSEIK